MEIYEAGTLVLATNSVTGESFEFTVPKDRDYCRFLLTRYIVMVKSVSPNHGWVFENLEK